MPQSLPPETVTGGGTLTGKVTLLGPAPPGGIDIAVISSNTALARPPANVFLPEGSTGATFEISTSLVTVPTQIVFSFGSPFEGYRSPDSWLVLMPPSSPPPPPAVSAVTLSPTTVLGGGTGIGTVTLTAPAPAGGALIRLSGSMEGTVVVPGSVTVPAGSTSVDFPIAAPPVARPHWVLIQASYSPVGPLHAATLRVDPGPPGPSPLYAIGLSPLNVVGGNPVRGTVGLTVPAPPGGMNVTLTSGDTSVAQVPAGVFIAAGNSTASFTITTASVASATSVSITGSAGGASKTAWLQVSADPNAPLSLLSISPSVSGAVGGNPINATLFLNKSAPAGGAVVSLTSSNPSAAQVPPTVTVPAGLGFASFDITTSPVSADTPVTITGTLGATRTTTVTVMALPVSLSSLAVNPSSVVGGTSSTGTVTLTAAAPAGGTIVALSSSNTAAATVPSSVTVPAGATSATFPVSTNAVATATTVSITGSAAGANRTATLTVNPNFAGFRGPTANAADSGGDGNGFESNAAAAHSDDSSNAVDNNSGTASTSSCTSSSRDSHRFFNYGLGVAQGSSVLGIEVRLDARVDGTSGAPQMCVQLSWDGGATWTASRSTPLTTTMTTYVLGGSADTWGRSWTAAELSDANFRVRIRNVANATSRDYFLDWIAVRIATGGAPPPDTTPPVVSVTAPASGSTVSGTVTIAAAASDNVGVTRVDFMVDGVLLGSDTTSPYSSAWDSTGSASGAYVLTARAFDAAGNQTTSSAVSVTVNNGSPPALDITLSGAPSSIRRGQFFTATGTVANTGGAAASGYTVLISFTPSSAMRLENPRSSTQTLATVAAGGTQTVSWEIRAESASSATLTMTLRNSSGVTVDTVTQAVTITN